METERVRPALAVWGWQAEAACRGMDSSVFFSPSDERGRARRHRERVAQDVCRTCPVRLACAVFALSTGQPHGVWGGLTEDQRMLVGTKPGTRAPA
jgi:WhiB family redox-sensing transcriptional regulator